MSIGIMVLLTDNLKAVNTALKSLKGIQRDIDERPAIIIIAMTSYH
jgi:hypothetical protein